MPRSRRARQSAARVAHASGAPSRITWPAWPELLAFALCTLLPLLGRGLPLDETAQPGVYWGRACLALLAAAILWQRPAAQRDSRVLWPLVALLALGFLSLWPRGGGTVPVPFGGALAVRYPADVTAATGELFRVVLLVLAGAACLRVRRGAVLAGIVTGAGLMVMVALREYLPNLRDGAANWRVFAGFVNPNQFAAYLLVAAPVCAAALAWVGEGWPATRWLAAHEVEQPTLKARVALGLVLVAVLVALGLTGSRGGLLAAMLGTVAFALALARSGGRRAAWFGMGAVLLVAGVALLGPLRARFVAVATQSHSQQFRLLTWQGTWDMVRAHPWLGVGLGGWPLAYGPYAHAAFTQHAHQDWLGIWSEVGLLGVLAWAALLGYMTLLGWRLAADRATAALGAAAVAAAIGIAVGGLIDTTWTITAVSGTLVVLLAVVAPVVVTPRPPQPVWRWAAAIIALLMLAPAVSESARFAGQQAAAAGALRQTAASYAQAIRIWPLNAAALEDAASVAARDDPAAARRLYARAGRLRPASARIYYRLANLEGRAGQPGRAVDAAARAVALSPKHLQSRLLLGQLLEQAGRPADALAAYEGLDAVATEPAMQVHALEYQLDTVLGEALLRIAALSRDAAQVADAKRRAIPVFDAWLATYDEAVATAGADADLQRAVLAARGMSAAERDQVLAWRELAALDKPPLRP